MRVLLNWIFSQFSCCTPSFTPHCCSILFGWKNFCSTIWLSSKNLSKMCGGEISQNWFCKILQPWPTKRNSSGHQRWKGAGGRVFNVENAKETSHQLWMLSPVMLYWRVTLIVWILLGNEIKLARIQKLIKTQVNWDCTLRFMDKVWFNFIEAENWPGFQISNSE